MELPMNPDELRLVAYGFQHFLEYLQSTGIVLAREGDYIEEGGYYELTTVETSFQDLAQQYIQSLKA